MPRHVIVVPCFNEQRRLDAGAFTAYAASHPDVHLLFVDDGSTDDTRAVLEGIRAAAPAQVGVLPLGANGGKAEAVRRGVAAALETKPDSFGFWDADLSTPLAEIASFCRVLEERPGTEVVIGSRVKLLGRDIQRKRSRHYAGRVFATCASFVLDLPVYDTQCGAKVFRNTPATRWAFRERFLSRWLFDVEILARLGLVEGARPLTERVYEHPLPIWRDVAGSKLRLRDFARAVVDLARIGCRYRWCARRARAAARA